MEEELQNPSEEYATTAELMLLFGKSIDDALDIHNALEKIVNSDTEHCT